MNENASQELGTPEDETRRFTIQIDGRLAKRIEALIDSGQFDYQSLPGFCRAAIYSFCAFQERTLHRLTGEDR